MLIMEGKSCTLHPKCKNKKGQDVESKLYKDLLSITGSDRSKTNEYYALAIDPNFLSMKKVRRNALFDENGEIALSSFLEYGKIDVKEDKIIDTIEKNHMKYVDSSVDYTQAIEEVASFNKKSTFNNKYMATLFQNSDGTFSTRIVKKTKANKEKLRDLIFKGSLVDILQYRLAQAGVSIDFLSSHTEYITENVEKSVNGLYQLIRISNDKNVDDIEIVRFCSQFALDSIENSPLAIRLINSLTEDAVRKWLGNDYDEDLSYETQKKQVAIDMIKEALLRNIDNTEFKRKSNIISLIKRVAQSIKGIFKRLDSEQIKKDIEDAKISAQQIANNFLSDSFEGSAYDMYKKEEEGFSDNNTKAYKEVALELRKLAEKLRVISGEDTYRQFMNHFKTIDSKINTSAKFIADYTTVDGIVSSIQLISKILTEDVPILLEELQFNNPSAFRETILKNSRIIRVLNEYTKTAIVLADIVDKYTTSSEGKVLLAGIDNFTHINADGTQESIDLIQITQQLRTAITGGNGLAATTLLKEKELFCFFCKELYGNDYIQHADKIVFSGFGTKKQKGEKINLSDLLNSLEQDSTIADRFIFAMSNNSDIIGQIVDKAVKQANLGADRIAQQTQDELRKLMAWAKSVGIENTSIFCDRDENGKITGNLTSPIDWYSYEKDFENFRKECIIEFKTTRKFSNENETKKAIAWEEFYGPRIRDWRRKNRIIYDQEKAIWIPDIEHGSPYRSKYYEENIQGNKNLELFLEKYYEIRRVVDSLLPEGSMPYYRMPQFKGTVLQTIKNKKAIEGLIPATGHSIWAKLCNDWGSTSEDYMYGSEQTYNSEEDEIFHNELASIKENTERLPLFGINRIKDSTELSTDLYYGLFAFSGMAAKYKMMSSIVDVLEIGRDVLANRKYGNPDSKVKKTTKSFTDWLTKSGDTPYAYQRYIKYIDKQVYGKSAYIPQIGKVFLKITQNLSTMASYYFLAGNVHGGLTNLGTGIIEIMKEGIAGEFFNMSDLQQAHKWYFNNIMQTALGVTRLGNDLPTDDLSLFMRYFNVQNDNSLKQREWNTQESKIANFLKDDFWFLPYKTGDHYMQSMAFLALANRIKLYDENGKMISLKDAYGILKAEDAKTKIYGIKGIYFKRRDDIKEYNNLIELRNRLHINNANNSINGTTKIMPLTDEDTELLTKHSIDFSTSSENLETYIDNKLNELIWNEADESSYMDKAREINTRMHGIYNSIDKPALSQQWYGNMLLAMKGYALGLIERRLSKGKYNIALGTDTEGSLVTLAKCAFTLLNGGNDTKTAIRLLLMPYSKKAEDEALKFGFSKNQYANLRRANIDFWAVLLLTLLKGLTAPPDEEEKEKMKDEGEEYNPSRVEGLIYYFTSRLLREQSAFNTLTGAIAESKQLMSLVPVGLSAFTDFLDLSSLFIKDVVFQDEDAYYKSNKKKTGVDWDVDDREDRNNYMYMKGDPKWQYKLWKRVPYLRSTVIWDDPYLAAKSYEFGRNVK